MAVFTYRAIDSGAAAISGTVIADTPRQARNVLRGRGLTIQDVTAAQPTAAPTWWQQYAGRRQAAKVAQMLGQLSTLVSVGIPLIEAIDTVARQYRGAFRRIVLMLRDGVAEGTSLAQAMRRQPALFDELVINIVEVGEDSGTLEQALEQAAQLRQRSLQLKGRIGSALLYPCIVLAMGIGVSLFLMTYVVPNLLSALTDAGKQLPLATRIVKSTSDLLIHRWWLILLLVGAAAAAGSLIMRSQRGRLLWHRLQLQLPVVGPLLARQSVVRIAMVISTLMRSGIVFESALQTAQRSTPNLVLRRALHRCQAAILAGRDIGAALEKTGAFDPVVVQVFAVGQQSGKLESMLEKLSADYDRQVTAAVGRLTSVLEPLLILLLALIVGFIAFATILPILEAGNVL